MATAPIKHKNSGIGKSRRRTHARPECSHRNTRNQIANTIHGGKNSESRTAHFLRQNLRCERFFERLLKSAVNSSQSKEHDQDGDRGRLEDKTRAGEGADKISDSQQASFSDAVTERAGWIGRQSVGEIVKSVEGYSDRRSSSGSETRAENLAGAEN